MFDIAQEFVTPHTVLGRCDEVGRKLLPLFTQLLQVVADVAVYPAAFQFVGFGENDGEGYSVLAQPVYGLRLVTAVDEDKEAGHLLALQNVGLYDALNLFLAFLSALGIAVARKVDDVPVLINQEMIDEHGLSRSCGRHGESFTSRQHVDEAGFSNVGTSDEGVFGECSSGAFFYGWIADDEAAGGVMEVVLALSTTMEGDTTNFYIYRKLEKLGVKLSVIARGISVGDELEYADEVTLGRSIVNRTPFTGAV